MNLKPFILVIFTFSYIECNSDLDKKKTIYNNAEYFDLNTVTPIEIAAVGRVSNLGDLYDARTDTFLQLSLFNSTLKNTTLIENRGTKLQYTLVNTYEEKFRTLDISAELKLSILGGLFKLDGSGRFFKDTKRSAKSAKASLIHSFQTKVEKISITDGDIKRIVDFNVLEQIDATHVVVGIQWGGNVFITVEDSNYDDKDVQTVEGSMGAEVKMLGGLYDVSGKAQVNISESERNRISKFNFEIYGDILPDDVPQNLFDAVKFMKTAPGLLQKANDGKGKAMSYNLIPVSLLRKLWNLSLTINSVLKTIDEATVKTCVRLFDDINKMEQKINDLVTSVTEMEPYIQTAKVQEIKDLQFNFDIYQTEVQRNLSEKLITVRSGTEEITKLQDMLALAAKHPYALTKIDLGKYAEINSQISFIKLFQKLNVTMLNKNTIFQQYLMENFNNDIYILFYNNKYAETSQNQMNMFRNMVETKLNFGPKAIFSAITYEIMKENESFNGYKLNDTHISLYRQGKLLVEKYEEGQKAIPDSKPELWSFYYMQQLVASHQNDLAQIKPQITQMQPQIVQLINNPVPVGYIYVQYPGQPEPVSLYKNVKWAEITGEHAGVFFRVLGGGSAAFGAIQESDYPRITELENHDANCERTCPRHFTIPPNGPWSTDMFLGAGFDGQQMNLKITVNQAELRPRNKAIRIWRRTA